MKLLTIIAILILSLGFHIQPATAHTDEPTTQPSSEPTTQPTAASVPTGDEVTVAVFDFTADGPASGELGKQVAEIITALLAADPNLTLVDRGDLDRVIDELELNLSGLVDTSAVEAGRVVGARLLVTGRIFSLNDTTYITAKVIGTETTRVHSIVVERADGKEGPAIAPLTREAATQLAKILREDAAELLPEMRTDPLTSRIEETRTHFADAPPSVYVSVEERHFGNALGVDPAVETELISVLRQAGLTIASTAESADFIIKGEAFSELGTRLGDLVSCSARVELKLDRADGKSMTNLWAGRSINRAADLGEQSAGKRALERAARDAMVNILDALRAS